MESARKAFAEAEHLVALLRSYCVNPSDPGDKRKGLDNIVADLDEVAQQLHTVEPLLATNRKEPAPAELIAAIENAENVVATRAVSTEAKYRTSLEADLVTLRRSIRDASREED